MLCSCGGDTCTAVKPAGPSTVSHSVAMSVHFHSKRCTNTSPAAVWPLGRYVGDNVGLGSGPPTLPVMSFLLPQPAASSAIAPAAIVRILECMCAAIQLGEKPCSSATGAAELLVENDGLL